MTRRSSDTRIVDGRWQELLEDGRWVEHFPSLMEGLVARRDLEDGGMAEYGTPSMPGTDFQPKIERTPAGGSGFWVPTELYEQFEMYMRTADRHAASVPADILTRQQEIEAAVKEISQWWLGEAQKLIAKTAPKAIEYGAHDLEIMGTGLASLVEQQLRGSDQFEKERFGQYAAVAFYLFGKISRMLSALQQGVLPKDDTEDDIIVYGFMAKRIRETGRWV